MVRVHGNYCGPNWSAGRVQPSVTSDVPAIDEFDQTCKEHDEAYAKQADLSAADAKFARANIRSGKPLRVVSGIAVGLQGRARSILRQSKLRGGKMNPPIDVIEDEYMVIDVNKAPGHSKEIIVGARGIEPQLKRASKMTLRRHKVAPATSPEKTSRERRAKGAKSEVEPYNPHRPGRGVNGVVPTNSMQTFVKSTLTRTVRASRHGETVEGTVFLSALQTATKQESSLDDLGLQALIPLNPGNLGNSMLANIAKFYERFQFTRLRVHYLTASATTTAGTVVLSHQVDPLNEVPQRGYQGANLYANLFSRENSLMGPVWDNAYMDIPCLKNKWFYNDAKYGHTMEDLYAGYILAYSTLASGTPGRLVLEFECKFDSRANEIGPNVPRTCGIETTLNIPSGTADTDCVASSITGPPTGDEGILVFYEDSGASNYSSSGGGAGYDDFLKTAAGEQFHAGVGAPMFIRQVAVAGNYKFYPTLEAAIGMTSAFLYKNTTTGSTYLVGQAFYVVQDSPEVTAL